MNGGKKLVLLMEIPLSAGVSTFVYEVCEVVVDDSFSVEQVEKRSLQMMTKLSIILSEG